MIYPPGDTELGVPNGAQVPVWAQKHIVDVALRDWVSGGDLVLFEDFSSQNHPLAPFGQARGSVHQEKQREPCYSHTHKFLQGFTAKTRTKHSPGLR